MKKFFAAVPRYWKAVVGFAAPAVVSLGAAVQPGSPGGTAVTRNEWVTAAVVAASSSAAVWGVPNAPKVKAVVRKRARKRAPASRPPKTSPQDGR